MRRFLRNPSEALRIKRAGDELRDYIVWKLYSVLERENLFSELETRPWWSFPDKQLARLVGDVLAEGGVTRWQGDTLVFSNYPKRPTITSKEAADMLPVIDKAMEALPAALLLGSKPRFEEVRPVAAKILDNFAVRLEFETAVEVAGLDELESGATVADIFPRVGASTLTLLENTNARVIVVEPFAENVEVIKSLVRLHHLEDRVSYVVTPLDRIALETQVDAVFMGECIHWLPTPSFVLAQVRKLVKPGGVLAMAQTVYSSLGLAVSLPGYLIGALRPPPSSEELRNLIETSGFEVNKWLESLGVALVRATTS